MTGGEATGPSASWASSNSSKAFQVHSSHWEVRLGFWERHLPANLLTDGSVRTGRHSSGFFQAFLPAVFQILRVCCEFEPPGNQHILLIRISVTALNAAKNRYLFSTLIQEFQNSRTPAITSKFSPFRIKFRISIKVALCLVQLQSTSINLENRRTSCLMPIFAPKACVHSSRLALKMNSTPWL